MIPSNNIIDGDMIKNSVCNADIKKLWKISFFQFFKAKVSIFLDMLPSSKDQSLAELQPWKHEKRKKNPANIY